MGKRRIHCSHDVLVAELWPYVRALALLSPDVSRHAGSVRFCEVCGNSVELQYGAGSYRPGLRVRVVSEAYTAQLTSKGIKVSPRRCRVALRPS